jgi:hypothetical protein
LGTGHFGAGAPKAAHGNNSNPKRSAARIGRLSRGWDQESSTEISATNSPNA